METDSSRFKGQDITKQIVYYRESPSDNRTRHVLGRGIYWSKFSFISRSCIHIIITMLNQNPHQSFRILGWISSKKGEKKFWLSTNLMNRPRISLRFVCVCVCSHTCSKERTTMAASRARWGRLGWSCMTLKLSPWPLFTAGTYLVLGKARDTWRKKHLVRGDLTNFPGLMVEHSCTSMVFKPVCKCVYFFST